MGYECGTGVLVLENGERAVVPWAAARSAAYELARNPDAEIVFASYRYGDQRVVGVESAPEGPAQRQPGPSAGE